ncbi:hypothetical protein lerEdw1_015106 [Lerista edwardsae]|nr:hypothetical protein lerEdw1_015107 [Lerista edwardsae]KAJ6616025.1 hypothetical protein lerEdw1_015106 [Lerista edwardsae]
MPSEMAIDEGAAAAGTMDCKGYKLATVVLAVIVCVLFIVVICLAIRLVIVCTGEQPRHSDSFRHRDHACPYGWFGYKGKCYDISEREMNWTASEGFCQSYNASLINTENEDEKEFLMHFKGIDSIWSNLRKEAQLWKYPSGANAT